MVDGKKLKVSYDYGITFLNQSKIKIISIANF
jgi:hypothetical protein